MSDNRESIASGHVRRLRMVLLLLLLLCMHVEMLFMRYLRPVTVTGRRAFSRMVIQIHIVCDGGLVVIVGHVRLIKLLEERPAGRIIKICRGGRVHAGIPKGGNGIDRVCLWDNGLVGSVVCKNVVSGVDDVEWLLEISRGMGIGLHVVGAR
jgi:hypothetical protein